MAYIIKATSSNVFGKTKLNFLHGDLFNKTNIFEMKVNAFHVEKNNFIKKTCLQKELFRADK